MTSADSRGRAAVPWLFVLALLLAALNFRAPFVGVSVVADEVRSALDVTSGEVGLLTSLPALCFGVAAPLALLVMRRCGAEMALAIGLGGVIAGVLLRSAGGFPAALAGTLLIGVAITVGNIVVPVLIRRRTPTSEVGMVTGAYTVSLNVGSMGVLVSTGPLVAATGWQVGLLAPALVCVVAFAVWWRVGVRPLAAAAVVPTAEPAPETGPVEPPKPLWREPVVVLLTLAFAGQAASYYSLTAWLPSVLADDAGTGAGATAVLSGFFQISAVLGAIGVPLLSRWAPEWIAIALVGALWMTFPIILLVAPEAHLVGIVLGGAAQGGGFAAIFTIVARVARSDRESAGMSTIVQGGGYTVAAIGPALMGAIHDVTGTWTAPLLVTVASTATMAVAGTAAAVSARRRTDRGPSA
ncbi:MFS transporter [Nocardioides zeae]|uniref:MFS transporter n=1 Tax=Nocardioides imazamoxiresistens TaxID=3231893 RepID=A0ABU3Q1K1_9ACTN|nr:MFS transporter [Nocardioides zeae]MDT9595383.1 MFS transporter [Nocardioides zeae]